MKTILASLTFLFAANGVFAQAAVKPAADNTDEAPVRPLKELQNNASGQGLLKNTTPEQLKRAEDNARAAVQSIMEAYQRNAPSKAQEFAPVQRKADQIADETLRAERDKALEFLGLDPDSDTSVNIFLSWSMPLEMMRAYVLDAMWSGANVYFRGVPPNKDLMTFVTKDLRSLVYGKNAANLAIDPRMFDAFNVDVVPAIVFSTTRSQFACKGVAPKTFTEGEKTMEYDTCNPLDPSLYWKVSGAVSTSFALNLFQEKGAPGIKPYLDAIAKGYAQGVPPGKEQQAYTGKWEDVLTPEEWEINRRYDERVKEQQAKEAKQQ